MHNAERPPVVVPVDPSQPTVIPDAYASQSRSPALSIALGLTAAVVVVGGGYWLMTR